MGYTDTILDVKSQRVRALLGLTGDSGDKPSERKTEPMVNGTEPSSLKDSGMVRYDTGRRRRHREPAELASLNDPCFSRSKPDMSDSATVLEAFKFIESAAAEFSDEEEEEDSEGREKTILDLAAVRTHFGFTSNKTCNVGKFPFSVTLSDLSVNRVIV